MRLVMFASAIAFGLVAGLSQANDWGEPRVGTRIVRLNPVIQGEKHQRPSAALKIRPHTPEIKYEIGPALGYVILGGALREIAAGTGAARVYGLGLALALTDHWYLSGEALDPDLMKDAYSTPGANTGRFIVRAAFRF